MSERELEKVGQNELEELVRRLNRGEDSRSPGPGSAPSPAGSAAGAAPPPPNPARPPGPGLVTEPETEPLFEPAPSLTGLLNELLERDGTDLHLLPGHRPFARVDGDLRLLPGAEVDEARLRSWFLDPLGSRRRGLLERDGAVDLSMRSGPARFRANVHRQRGGLAVSLRRLPDGVPGLERLRLPAELVELVRPMQGIVLVCGPTGAGKSTTLAALVDWLNHERRGHIITLEDPVEYEHAHRGCLIEQLEVGVDTPSFAAGLKAALRQDPDVILLGEMRDLESISTALAAAETGHLVLSTVHTSDTTQALHRVLDVFPAQSRDQTRQLLAAGLEAVICQQLVPRIGGGRVPAVEILRATDPVRHHIRSGALHKIYNELVLGRRVGMRTMEAALADLVRAGEIEREAALIRSSRPEEMESLLRSGVT